MRKVLLGVTGSIAAIKVPALCRLLRDAGWEVKIVLSYHAKDFVTPLALKALNDDEVYTDEDVTRESLLHIRLARWADVLLIAPASAQTMAKLAYGIADNLLTSIYLATTCEVVVAPAMNHHMWNHVATAQNCSILQKRGVLFFGPDSGAMASKKEGEGSGRLLEPDQIVRHLSELAQGSFYAKENKIYENRHVVITAGPTREPIDPVRFISNRSSGKMGYALAQAARDMGAKVTLISGPVNLQPPFGVHVVQVQTASDMLKASIEAAAHADLFIGASAVSDWHIKNLSPQKIKRDASDITLSFAPNMDIVATVTKTYPQTFVVAFAAETEDALNHAKDKLIAKGCQMIILNDVSRSDIGFDVDQNEVTLISIDEQGKTRVQKPPKMSKIQLGFEILKKIEENRNERAV